MASPHCAPMASSPHVRLHPPRAQQCKRPPEEYHVYHDHCPAAYCAEEEEELVDARLSAYVCGVEEMERVQEMIRSLQSKYREFSAVISLKSDEVQKLNSDILKRNDELHTISQRVRQMQNEKTQQEHQLREVSLSVSTKQRELERLSKAISNERLDHANDVAHEKLTMAGIVRARQEEETALERLRQQRLEEELKLRLCIDKQTLHNAEQSHLHWEAQDKQKQAALEREQIAALDAVLERQRMEMSEKLGSVADDRLHELDTLKIMQKTALESLHAPAPWQKSVEDTVQESLHTSAPWQTRDKSVKRTELDATVRAESELVSVGKPSSRRYHALKTLNDQMRTLRQTDRGRNNDIRLSLETATVLFDSIISANTQIDSLKGLTAHTSGVGDNIATKDLEIQSLRSQLEREKEVNKGSNRTPPPMSTLPLSAADTHNIPLLGSPEMSNQIPRAHRADLVAPARSMHYRDNSNASVPGSPVSPTRREGAIARTRIQHMPATHLGPCNTLFNTRCDVGSKR